MTRFQYFLILWLSQWSSAKTRISPNFGFGRWKIRSTMSSQSTMICREVLSMNKSRPQWGGQPGRTGPNGAIATG